MAAYETSSEGDGLQFKGRAKRFMRRMWWTRFNLYLRSQTSGCSLSATHLSGLRHFVVLPAFLSMNYGPRRDESQLQNGISGKCMTARSYASSTVETTKWIYGSSMSHFILKYQAIFCHSFLQFLL